MLQKLGRPVKVQAKRSVGFPTSGGWDLKMQARESTEDVVIGSGGLMLARFVQALYFARSCKDLIRMNLVLDSRSFKQNLSKSAAQQLNTPFRGSTHAASDPRQCW